MQVPAVLVSGCTFQQPSHTPQWQHGLGTCYNAPENDNHDSSNKEVSERAVCTAKDQPVGISPFSEGLRRIEHNLA